MEGNVANTRRSNENEFNLKEWHLKARISKESHNTSSRRFSASYIRSFREDSSRSFRSNFTISSTASSPGYPLKDEIDPSTYSFTTALKALQGRSGYVWECLSPEGFALNSKWNEAERYICNPYSGEVPMECLSSKTLNGRSFRSYMASRVTMSAPLVYSVHHPRTTRNHNHNHINNQISKLDNQQIVHPQSLFQGNRTRDVGIQSRLAPPPSPPTPPPPEGSLSSPSAISTPSIRERSINRCEDTEDQDEDVQNSSSSVRSNVVEEVKVKVTREKEDTKRKSKEGLQKKKRHKTRQLCVCKQISGCNLISSWKNLLMKRSQKAKTISPQI